jgi:hypothetical protein
MFSENKSRARKHYRAFMNDREVLGKEEVYATVDQRLQGDESFVERVREKYDGEIPGVHRKKEHTLTAIARAVEQEYGVTLEELRSARKQQQIMKGRKVFVSVAKQYGYRGRAIAEYLSKEPSSVSKYLHGEDVRADTERVIKRLVTMMNSNFQA